ncbi:hypothetical protein FOA52_001254 [Chlamydomonas sp. UWO 241]|nr:hypothetical protein FOA52_001254 [Chlamydomonas sp. UWO 241]
MATNAWAVAPAPTAWADDEEEAQPEAPAPAAPTTFAAMRAAKQIVTMAADDFPSLGEAVKVVPKGKKKAVKLGLGDFLSAGAPTRVQQRSANDDKAILAMLPKAPLGEDRPEGDDGRGGLGGGFGKEYGGGDRYGARREGGGGFGDRDGGDRERGGFGRDREGGGEGGFGNASREEESSDWGSKKEFVPSGGGRDGGRGGGFGSDRPQGASDGVNDWGAKKEFVPSTDGPRGGGGGGFGGGRGFEDRGDRPGGFGDRGGDRPMYQPSKADGEDEWGKGRVFTPSDPPGGARGGDRGGDRPPGRGFGFSDRPPAADEGDRWERRGLPPPEDSRDRSSDRAGGGAPAERPRLKIAPRTIPVEEVIAAANAANGAAAAAAAPAAPVAAPAAPSVKSNPFGAARPREEVLKEKGVDPAKEPVRLAPVVRDEAPEELALKAEAEKLRKQLEVTKLSAPDPESIADEVASAQEEICSKEAELAKLSVELDAKARKQQADAAAAESAAQADGTSADDGSWARAGPPPAKAPKDAPAKKAEGTDAGDAKREGGGGRSGGDGGRGGRGEGAGRVDSGAPRPAREATAFAGAPGKDRW